MAVTFLTNEDKAVLDGQITALSEEMAEITKPPETTTGRIVQITTEESSNVVVESDVEVFHAGRNLFEVGESNSDYVKSSYFVSTDPMSQTICMKVGGGSAAHAIRNVKIPFKSGMSIHVATECVDSEVNVAVPMLHIESADGTVITSGRTGAYNAFYTGFIPTNHDDAVPPTSYTFTCNNDSVAYCCIGVILKSDKGIETGAEVNIRIMAEIENPTGKWEAGFLNSHMPVNGLAGIQTAQGVNNIYAADQSEIVVSFGTNKLVTSVNNKKGRVVLTAEDVGAVSDALLTKEYDTVSEMLADEKLVIGQKARTRGYYTMGDGGAASYTVDATDNGYGLACVNGYCNIIAETRMSPKMFGATANGDYWNTNDTEAFQSCLDFCAGRYIVDLTNGRYVISGVKLYHGNTYDIVGGNKQQEPTDSKSSSCIIVKYPQNTAAFVGSNELGADGVTGLPVVVLNLRDVQIESYYLGDVGYPTFIKDVWLMRSRIDNVYVKHIGCFIDGIMSAFSTVSNCIMHVSDCAFRSNRVVDNEPYEGFVDCAFYSNFFQGITKFNDLLFKPVVFDARKFYTTQFSSNFIGGMWAVVGCRRIAPAVSAEFLGWWSRDNVYSFVVEFATILDDSDVIYVADAKFFGDQMWNCSKASLVDTPEGQLFFSDNDGNTRIEGDRTIFFNFTQLDCGTLRDIVVRFSDPLFPEEMRLERTTITNPVYLFPPEGADHSEAEHLFDTKIPISRFVEMRNERYKYTRVEPWNNRVCETLPVIQDGSYRYVLEGQTCYYNNKLLTCRGDSWYDTMGNVVAE